MISRKVVFSAVGIVIFLFAIFLTWPQPQKPEVTFDLADGTSINVKTIKSGKVLRFYEGQFWQRIFFAVCRTNISVRLRGVEFVIPATYTNGSTIVLLSHLKHTNVELDYFKKHGVFTVPVNGSSRLAQTILFGKEANGWQRVVNFDTADGGYEDIYWEFPLSREPTLRFCFYNTNAVNHTVSTNEFSIHNPAIK